MTIMKHITCENCGHHTVTDNNAPELTCVNCRADMQDLPVDVDKITCGSCGSSWCDKCDPAPSALCHICHGRGYSTAPYGEKP